MRLVIRVLGLFMSIVRIWFSFAFLIVGRILYGSDASLLWASGMLFIIAVNVITEFLRRGND